MNFEWLVFNKINELALFWVNIIYGSHFIHITNYTMDVIKKRFTECVYIMTKQTKMVKSVEKFLSRM